MSSEVQAVLCGTVVEDLCGAAAMACGQAPFLLCVGIGIVYSIEVQLQVGRGLAGATVV